jgi:Protein of unknown function (DUF2844)
MQLKMKARPSFARPVLVLASLGLLLTSSYAQAALDEVLVPTSSEVHATQVAGQTMLVRTRGNVKEIAGADGKIFAATWRGHRAPDLQVLLGPHFAAYAEALRARRPGGHNHLFISTPELTVNVYAHARMLTGKAWLKQKLPAGVSIDAIQ